MATDLHTAANRLLKAWDLNDLIHEHIEALRQALANEALDKMAENARELGLDYEPSSVSKLAREAGIRDCTCNGTLGCLERFAELVRADERARMAEQPAQQEQLREENERLHVENRRLIDRIETIGVPVGVGGFATTTTAQRTWVEVEQVKWEGDRLIAKLKENT